MTDPDYYSVMERCIKYYANKYDPEDRLLNCKKVSRKADLKRSDHELEKVKKSPRRKIIATLFSF
jgi:hypothetical protein